MNKAELIDILATKMAATKTVAEDFLNTLLDTASDALANGDSITLVGFGTFDTLDQAERMGRNPQTGASIKIAARKKIRFKPGKSLKDKVNS